MITPEQKLALLTEAKNALKNPYQLDSTYIYAAAVLTDTGNIYTGTNYFSDTYSLTLHGEQAALAHAAAHGEGNIQAIVCTSNEDLAPGEFTAPCHMCKQLLWESRRRSKIPMQIILLNGHNETKDVWLDDIMQLPWPAL